MFLPNYFFRFPQKQRGKEEETIRQVREISSKSQIRFSLPNFCSTLLIGYQAFERHLCTIFLHLTNIRGVFSVFDIGTLTQPTIF